MEGPSTKIQLHISCRKLKKMDKFTESDPMAVVFIKQKGRYVEVDRSEMIKDTADPDFQKAFILTYCFEQKQEVKIGIYDVDNRTGPLTSQDFLGEVATTVGEIMGSAHGSLTKNLERKGKPTSSTVHIHAEELSDSKGALQMKFRAHGLDKKDMFGKSDPFLVFKRASGAGTFSAVKKTEVIKKTLDPTWQKFDISVADFCNGDHSRKICIECFDWDSDGSHDLIGICETTLTELLSSSPMTLELINKKKLKKKKYKNSGTLEVMECHLLSQSSFLDYIVGGFELSFTVAIDFTGSNGDPQSPKSLHYRNPFNPNQYQQSMSEIGEIIEAYDSDKLFPALGFGAKDPTTGQVQHLFSLTGDMSNPYCSGLAGVQQAYQDTLQHAVLWGPTHFAPVINHVAAFARDAMTKGQLNYFVLLIITDGAICDMDNTTEAVVQAASLPMSIIIVGVGAADFSSMEQLDGDHVQLESRGRKAERDIVQFVPFRKYKGNTQGALAQEILAEVPTQFLKFMKKHNITPPQRPVNDWSSPQMVGGAPAQPPAPAGGGYPAGSSVGYPGNVAPPASAPGSGGSGYPAGSNVGYPSQAGGNASSHQRIPTGYPAV